MHFNFSSFLSTSLSISSLPVSLPLSKPKHVTGRMSVWISRSSQTIAFKENTRSTFHVIASMAQLPQRSREPSPLSTSSPHHPVQQLSLEPPSFILSRCPNTDCCLSPFSYSSSKRFQRYKLASVCQFQLFVSSPVSYILSSSRPPGHQNHLLNTVRPYPYLCLISLYSFRGIISCPEYPWHTNGPFVIPGSVFTSLYSGSGCKSK